MRVFKLGKRKSVVERKLGLFLQTRQLMKELDKLRKEDHEDLQSRTGTSRWEFVNGIDLITKSSINCKEK